MIREIVVLQRLFYYNDCSIRELFSTTQWNVVVGTLRVEAMGELFGDLIVT